MAKYPVKNAKIGIVMESTSTGVLVGATAFEDDDYAGAMYANSATRPFVVMPVPTDVSLDISPMEETITTVSDDFEHDIHIRSMGSGSFELVQWIDDTGSGVVDSRHLMYLAKNFARGITSAIGEAAHYSIFSDTATTKATDKTGYAIIIESKYVTSAGTTKYIQHVFHNAKIKATPTIGPQKANRLRVDFSDARHIDGPVASDTTFANHSDS